MSSRSRFLPYPKNFGIFKSRSLNSIPENNLADFHMSLNEANPTMAQATDIISSLRIPDVIKDLPKFDGNPRLLYEFVSNVEEILLFIKGTDNTPQGQILLRAIRNKIDGQANEVLNMYGTPLNWDDIKRNLISHYSDKRTETSLIRDLHSLKQYGKPLEKYFSEVMEIQSALYNNLSIHENERAVINAKRELFSEMCLNSFLSGLREPMGSTVRAMRPGSLALAFEYCIGEQNIHYSRSDFYRPRQNRWGSDYPNARNFPYRRDFGNNFNTPRGNLDRPNRQIYSNNNNQSFNSSYYNRDANRYQYQPQNRNGSFNDRQGQAFRTTSGQTNWRQSQPPLEPMDTSTTYTKLEKDSTRFKSNPSTRFSRFSNRGELNNVDGFGSASQGNCKEEDFNKKRVYTSNQDMTNLDRYEEGNIDDNQDFRHFASKGRQDT